MYYKMRILPVIIAKFGILEYLKHQNAYAIMPVGKHIRHNRADK